MLDEECRVRYPHDLIAENMTLAVLVTLVP